MSPPIRFSPGRPLSIIAATLLAVYLTGCCKSPPLEPLTNGGVAASASKAAVAGASGYGAGSFYPLAIGNRWAYQGGGMARVLPGDGGPPVEDFNYAFTETRQLIGTTHHEGTEYVVEEQVHHSVPESYFGPTTWWSRIRQDRLGLFVLDTLLQAPPIIDGVGVAATHGSRVSHPYRIDPAVWLRNGLDDASLERFADRVEMLREAVRGIIRRSAGPAAPTGLELRFLVYPLHPGTSWSTRPDFPWPAWVDGVENLDTPAGKFPAYRIRLNPFGTALQDGEWIYLWYSRQGYLGYSIHTFALATGPNGEPTGAVYVLDDSMKVTSVQVAR